MSNSGSNSVTHLLVFPFPAHGHMLPLLDLTHQLVLRGGSAVKVTILVTPKNLPFLQPLISKHPTSVHALVLPFPTTPDIPSGVENMKDLPVSYIAVMIRAMGQLYNPLLQWLQSNDHGTSSSPRPVAILSDMFLAWTHNLATHLNIHRVAFYPCAGYAVSVVRSFWQKQPDRNTCKDMYFQVCLPDFPSSYVFPLYHIFGLYRAFIEGGLDWETMTENHLSNRASWGTILNSFTELEQPFLDHFKNHFGVDRLWTVGPLVPMVDAAAAAAGPIERGGPSANHGEIISWLDTCSDRSVVYVCFGTQILLSRKQLEAIASGLEESGAHFIWVVKEDSSNGGDEAAIVVPPGFEERVRGKGLVIRGWAPQVAILRHRAVAAYLTHCGWGSAMEGIVAGVQLLVWPMQADHFNNTKLLVDHVGVAIKVCEGVNTVPDPNELARIMAESVSGVTSPGMARALEMKKMALQAISEGGSSWRSLEGLVVALCGLNEKLG